MKPENITAAFVEARYTALKERWASRNDRMDDYEKLYKLDMWEDEAEPDERRITVPTCFNEVEANRTLLLTRPPVISVPPSDVKGVETERADSIEKFLIGAWAEGRVMYSLVMAEWYATTLGAGVLRVVYDDQAVEDELPLVVQALDPRTVYPSPSGKAFLDLEVCHAFERIRREIEDEWGVELEMGPEGEGASREEWLDDTAEYIEYWRVDVEEVEEAGQPQGLPQQAEEEMGPLARLVAAARRAMGLREQGAQEEGRAQGGQPQGLPQQGEREGEGEKRKVRRRVVTHCVVVEGQFVKEPVKMPGYRRLPFVRYAGIGTPLADEDGDLSVLFPMTGGVRKGGAVGVAAAEAEAVAMRQRLVEMYANGALMTDDDQLTVDFTPGAVNYTRKDSKWSFLVPPGPHPAVDQQVQLLKSYIEDASVPAAMKGRYVGALSGLALSALTNPVLMKIASRQMVREWAYELVNEMLLQLAEEYAPPDGWSVWGVDRKGVVFEAQLRPEEIGGYYRNRVELSASLPKDEAGEVMGLAQLVGRGLISRETFLDQLQRIKQLSSQSPIDEMKRILRDKLLFEGPTAEKLAQVVMSEWSAEMAQALGVGQPPAQPPPGPMPPGAGPVPPGPPGAGPPGPPGMMGMPPGVVPPGAVPQALGMQEMMAMMGGAPPGPPGPGPGRGGV